MLEVELKFRVAEPDAVRRRLDKLNAARTGSSSQRDLYFNHPARDFATTDEALRLRSVGDQTVVTYKGPKQGTAAKTRFELELPLAEQTAEGWAELLDRLGFRRVREVNKRRAAYHLERTGRRFEVSIDEVEGLGVFVEVETLVEAGDAAAAEQAVQAFAAEIGLRDPEPRSYLEMLLG